MTSVKTEKGTVLPLLNLKGKPYMQVAHRIVWFAEQTPNYKVEVDLPVVSEEMTLAKVTVSVLDADNRTVVRQTSDFKRETKKDFPDHTEKAVTGALGRCLATLGYGTAYALADLDEGDRIVDSPVPDVKASLNTVTTPKDPTLTLTNPTVEEPKKRGFQKVSKPAFMKEQPSAGTSTPADDY